MDGLADGIVPRNLGQALEMEPGRAVMESVSVPDGDRQGLNAGLGKELLC